VDKDAEHELRYSDEAVYQGAEALYDEGGFDLNFSECERAATLVAEAMKLWFEGIEK
jgi:hypothetical protein